ncbi:tRNA (N6-isopentenyl adenosine(37)-C2)-methylthiotransferase MiaB [Alphaproteobacteria bacterium]|nr:tRNA (N6-isopentenyl adenosine(37)-C2)-methylthiotransferase MiaB [Alphaproteobacteria bacterium]MDA7799436.1 tRNA (N6-isopentenyl adenosine(37)-C2)-methylthiotransferase MiaB [Alphaproteobacteria bacterium]MDA8872275.1 tRNA (N6-isopentenyl adenosine(37)-C2)-methylthiotransferase MiaB [Alphaproteobacteria bacterium]MDA8943103.1 tRNA (N6-isopentenyl adenosine(37)-C2)-methylthiotransferase MiaB [Alphaproteobacteria bacterium]MDA9013806.1 tRNA (N6-isopentenyl adenosine(37)-C2)-methylthiotransfe
MTKKLFIKTYGCQMNVYDSDRMTDVLAPLGYAPTDMADGADMVILNTCHIREKASEKVFSELGRLRQLKERAADQQGRQVTIAVAGCVAQAEGEEIIRRAPWVDIVVGPQTYHRLPELVGQIDPASRNRIIDTDFPEEVKFDFLPGEHAPRGPAAFLSVQEGCDKFCAFCVVPYTRGAEFSRPAKTVLEEAKRLVASGTRELTLLGQNVNAYHGEHDSGKDWNLGRLIRALAEVDGLERIRYTTSHPLDMDDELIAVHGEVPQLMPYLHLPIQSGSNHILQEMNRRHTSDVYLAVIDKLRAIRPDIAMSGDFIVGFPGESDADFAETLALVSKVGYASAYSFKYSPRPGTPAATAEIQVPESVKSERLESLQQLLNAQQFAFNKGTEGKIVDILVERAGGRDGQMAGRSPYMQAVNFIGHPDQIGQIVPCRLSEARQNSMTGDIVNLKGAA